MTPVLTVGASDQLQMADSQDVERLVNSDVWTPNEQVKELKRRFVVGGPHEFSFQPRADDIIVAVPPKCGTTWLLHICHQIRMQGAEPDFDDQNDVITWIENSKHFFNLDPDEHSMKQPPGIRILKSHLPYPAVPKGGKMIYCFRDQSDALYSSYKFVNSILSLKGRVTLPVFANDAIKDQFLEDTYRDLLTWWEHRHNKDVLFLFFDDLKEDHAGTVRRIAKFVGVECSDEVLAHVVHTTTHAEMAKHSSKFDAHNVAKIIAEKVGEKPEIRNDHVGCVRKDGGKSGEGRLLLPVDVQQYIDQKWQEMITDKLGYRNLKEMQDAWRNDN